MSSLDNMIPKVSETPVAFRKDRGAWPGLLREALRKADSKGMSRNEIAASLGCLDQAGAQTDVRGINSTIDYLIQLGLATWCGTRLHHVVVGRVPRFGRRQA